MEFQVVTSKYAQVMTQKVTSLLNEGWELAGELQVTKVEDWGHFKKQGESLVFAQALTKQVRL